MTFKSRLGYGPPPPVSNTARAIVALALLAAIVAAAFTLRSFT